MLTVRPQKHGLDDPEFQLVPSLCPRRPLPVEVAELRLDARRKPASALSKAIEKTMTIIDTVLHHDTQNSLPAPAATGGGRPAALAL